MARVSLIIIDAAQAYAEIVGYVFQTFYRDSLSLAGVAHDGASALALARQQRPDIALLDFHTPGLDLIAGLRVALGHGRIIVLGSDEGDEYDSLARASGAAAYVAKSAINTRLLPVVCELLAPSPAQPCPPLALPT